MSKPLPYLDATRDHEARLKDLLARMTPEEKLRQRVGLRATDLLDGSSFDEVRAVERLAGAPDAGTASSRDIRLRATVVLQGERRPLLQQQVVATHIEVVEMDKPKGEAQ
jgi:hypothetical protein